MTVSSISNDIADRAIRVAIRTPSSLISKSARGSLLNKAVGLKLADNNLREGPGSRLAGKAKSSENVLDLALKLKTNASRGAIKGVVALFV